MNAGPTIDHIGVIVDNLEEAAKSMERFLGITPEAIKEMPDPGIRIIPFKAANITIELIEYLTSEESFGRDTMGDTPGLNHISKKVDDIDGAIERLCGDGFNLLGGFPAEGAAGPVAFFAPDNACSIRMEICQHRKRENG